jgi:uncharacterized LabA/DUF88 family protein
MKRYAFIDVPNTAQTAHEMLGFVVDWSKFAKFLEEKWMCEKAFFYPGIEEGDTKTTTEFDALKSDKSVVRAKAIISYKNPDKEIPRKCKSCGREDVVVVPMGYRRKANCDVELTVDAFELAKPETEFFIFSGDGDFSYLIEKILEKGGIVKIVSNASKWTDLAGRVHSRFAKKLRELINAHREKVFMIDLASIQGSIKKDIPNLI